MTVRGLAFAACLTLALTGASARADDAERTKVYGLVPPRAPHAPCHGGGRMGDQMALPSLGLGAFGGLPLPTGFFAVRASSGPGASVAPRDENAFFFDALFSQPERVTRAVYFSRALGDFGGASFKEKAPAIGAVLVNDADDAFQRTESRDETRDESFEAFDDLAEAVARADSVMDALVRWRDDSESGDERLSRTPFPFAAWFETSAPFEEETEAFYEEEAPRRRQSPKPPRPYTREGFSLDDDDARDASPATRAAVGVAAFLLMVAAAVACARLVLAACDWFCRAVFGEEEEEAFAEKEDAFVDVAEVSLAAPLLVAYETEERATDARDDDDDDDGEQLLVVVPAEAEGRR